MFGAKVMKEKNNLTIVERLEYLYNQNHELHEAMFAQAKFLERMHIIAAFEAGKKSKVKTGFEYFDEIYESEKSHRLVEMITYADKHGYAKALKKFTDENKSGED
jgi:hypothetical protein